MNMIDIILKPLFRDLNKLNLKNLYLFVFFLTSPFFISKVFNNFFGKYQNYFSFIVSSLHDIQDCSYLTFSGANALDLKLNAN
jgi:hypothetical protein